MLSSVAVLGVLLALAFWQPPGNLALAVYGISPGQVRIEWNRRSRPVLQARSGVLTILDGTHPRVMSLDPAQLRSTSFTYSLQTDHISVNLRVQHPGKSAAIEESVQFVGQPAPTPSPVQPSAVPDPPHAVPAEIARGPAEEETRESRPVERPAPSSSRDLSRTVMAATNRANPVRMEKSQEAPLALPPAPPIAPNRTMAALPEALPNVLRDSLPSVRPPAEPAITTAPAAPPVSAPSYTGPRSGRVIWTGALGRHGVVEIEGNHSNTGSLAGALPGVPVSIRISPSEFGRNGLVVFTSDAAKVGRREPPSAANGWNAVDFQRDPERERGLLVLEPPNRANDYNRLVLRSDLRNCAIIVIDWTVLQ
jgi:hypothetical protein